MTNTPKASSTTRAERSVDFIREGWPFLCIIGLVLLLIASVVFTAMSGSSTNHRDVVREHCETAWSNSGRQAGHDDYIDDCISGVKELSDILDDNGN